MWFNANAAFFTTSFFSSKQLNQMIDSAQVENSFYPSKPLDNIIMKYYNVLNCKFVSLCLHFQNWNHFLTFTSCGGISSLSSWPDILI